MIANKNPEQKGWRRFILKALLFFGIIYLADFALGKTLEHFYFKQESGLQYRTTFSINETKADLLVFGSSRANHHYVPQVIEPQFKMSYYNVGRDGASILYHYAVLKAILLRYHPKMILLDLNLREFEKDQRSYDQLAALLPYYASHPEMRSILALRSKSETFKLMSHIYPYNSSLVTIAVGNMEFNKIRKQDTKGYVALKESWTRPIQLANDFREYKIDSTKVNYYKLFLKACLSKNISLHVVCSPSFEKSLQEDLSVRKAKDIAKEEHVNFYDFSSDSTFLNHSALFADVNHLNDQGAFIFTHRVSEAIFKSIVR